MNNDLRTYRVYVSLFEHMNDGFVWLKRPDLPPRCIVKITHSLAKESVFCEALQLEDNFLTEYNKPNERRLKINNPESSIVMSSWYRKRLGNLEPRREYSLRIDEANVWGWGKIRACNQHPQNVVRIATRLGIISVVFGIVGLLLGLLRH